MHFTNFQEFYSPLLYRLQTPRRGGTFGNTLKRRAGKRRAEKG